MFVFFQPYWNLINYGTLKYFMHKSKTLKKLDLSWCGNDTKDFEKFRFYVVLLLKSSNKTLTHISLGNCKYINDEIVTNMATCGELVGNLEISM